MDCFSEYKPPTSKIPFQNKRYHVFLSFRGPDVRQTFVHHLSESLYATGIRFYYDDLLEQAIEDATIPFFTTNYASPAWCLRELKHMCNSKTVRKPLSYDVQPRHVRHANHQPKLGGETRANREATAVCKSEAKAEDQRDAGGQGEREARAEAENETNPYSEELKEHLRKGRHPLWLIDEWGQSLKNICYLRGYLENGQSIDNALKRAIEDSAICIPIFSKNYASSPHCLQELTHMCKCKALIIPLFYDVQPFQVRTAESESQGSRYAEVLRVHYSTGRYPPEAMEEWKQALHQITSLPGWTLDTRSCLEGDLVKRIVCDVTNTLDEIPLHNVAKHPVQLDNKIQDVIRLLKLHNKTDVLTLGIWGMGGCGKTVIAKAVFNNIFQSFDCCSFLSDVRKMSQKKFQEHIIRDKVKSFDEDWSMIAQVSVAKRALVILDDIDDSKQLELLTWENWGGPGSRIIVTTRDKHVLNLARINAVYKMERLDHDDALRLFNWHAFLSPEPDKKFKEQSERIVEACGGLPLAIVAVGGHLHDKKESLDYWREALSTPQSICHQKIYDVLKISYDNLSYQEKRIFLDIACIFTGKETKQAIRHWKRFKWDAYTAITNLEHKSLITIGNDNVFMMHKLLRDMGKAIRGADKSSPFSFNFLTGLILPTDFCRMFATNKRFETAREGENPFPGGRNVQESAEDRRCW
ncbi:hypothetical protein SUGI_0337210 [Cryptomeria japonica]|nr:hypothetical protein SUGI_0337210 [Cryptomeria japonica]